MDEKSQESFIAKKIFHLLSDYPAFDGKEIKDFLDNKRLFDVAKEAIYDILTDEDKQYFNLAERVLRGNDREKQQIEKQEQKENEDDAKMVHSLFVGLRQRAKQWLSSMDWKFLLHWEFAKKLIITEIKKEIVREEGIMPNDEEIKSEFEVIFSDTTLKEYDILTLPTLMINTLKRCRKALGLSYLPEYITNNDMSLRQDRCNTNMNTVATLMWIPMSSERNKKFSKESLSSIRIIESNLFSFLMYHYEIDTPEKLKYLWFFASMNPFWRYRFKKILQDFKKFQITTIFQFLQESLRQEFWIKNVPIEKLKTIVDTTILKNYNIYFANCNSGNIRRDGKILKLFLGLQLHDMRKDFKIGKKINFSELFEEGIIGELSEYLQKMKNYTLLTSYDEITQLKIQEDTMTQRQVVVTTTREMDTSLLQQDIQDLMDIDNFPNQSQLFNLLCTYKKGVGKTLNLLFRKQLLSPEFQKIQWELEQTFWQLTEENILKLEKLEKSLSVIINFVEKTQKTTLSLEEFEILFVNMCKQISSWIISPLLMERIQQIQSKLSKPNETISYTTRMTNDFDIIIPNIRWCLQCRDKGSWKYNFTNLTFWDPNKFFMAVYGIDEKETIADAIVDIFPYTLSDITTETDIEIKKYWRKKLAFMIERVYGERTPDVLLSIIQTIRKKQEEAGLQDIAIFISDSALNSCYTTLSHLQEEYKEKRVSLTETSLNIEHIPSPSGYEHIELQNEWILLQILEN